MDSFLQEQHHAGRRHSSGAFTISPEQARRRLQVYQLARSDYLLKIVQAAVSCGTDRLEVRVGRDRLEMSFNVEDGTLTDPAGVADAMLRIHSLSPSPLRHLAVGLNAACAQDLLEIRWETPAGTLLLTDRALDCKPGKIFGCRLTLRKRRTFKQWFLGSLYTEELCALQARCVYAPIEIFIDGRPLERPTWDRYGHFGPDDFILPNPHYLLERVKLGGQQMWLRMPPPGNYEDSPGQRLMWGGVYPLSRCLTPPPLPLLLECDMDPSRVVVQAEIGLAVRPVLRGGSQVLFVKDGVSLDPLAVEDLGHPGVIVLAGAGDLAVDLSELQVLRDHRLEARLADLRQFVRESTEAIEEDELRAALSKASLQGRTLEVTVRRVMDLLKTHAVAPAHTVEELVRQVFHPAGRVYLSPDIPAAREGYARAVHQEHLPADETVLVLYDDTLAGNAKDGFLVTPRRLCWRNAIEASQYVMWEHLTLDGLKVERGKVWLLGTTILCTLLPDVAFMLGAFLRAVGEFEPEPSHGSSPKELDLLRTAVRHLGKGPRLHYHPCIPRKLLATIGEVYRDVLNQGDVPLVLYDDTVMGGAEDGFVVTRDKLCWKNFFTDVRSVDWGELKRTDVLAAEQGVRVGGETILVCETSLREPVVAFFAALVASAKIRE